jgi:hypothetical protein
MIPIIGKVLLLNGRCKISSNFWDDLKTQCANVLRIITAKADEIPTRTQDK